MKRSPRPKQPPIRPVPADQLARVIAAGGLATVACPAPPRGGWDGNHNPKRLSVAAAVGGGWDQNHHAKRLRVSR